MSKEFQEMKPGWPASCGPRLGFGKMFLLIAFLSAIVTSSIVFSCAS